MTNAAASTTMTAHAVTAISKRTVRCANEASLSKLDSPMKLGPLDQLVFPTIPIAVVFVYRPSNDATELIPVDRLERALSLLLDHYPHLTGRLHINDDNGVREINRLNTGAELHSARCASRLDAITSASGRMLLADLPDGGNALLAPFTPTVEAVCRDPILTIQHTRFACGGVALGARVLHTVCDADGFFRLMSNLAELYRSDGREKLARPPHLRPYLAQLMHSMTAEEREAALAFEPPLHSVEPDEAVPEYVTAPPAAQDEKPAPPVVGRVVRFSSAQLAALKAHATAPPAEDADGGEGGNDDDDDDDDGAAAWVSTFDALSAHIWQRTHRARLNLLLNDHNNNDNANHLSRSFLTSVNYRARLGVAPASPFNVLATPYTALPHAVLASAPLWRIAATVHALTRTAVKAEEAEKTARWVAAQPDVRRVRWARFDGRPGSAMVSAWNKFDGYGAAVFDDDDDGNGRRPALVAPPFTVVSLVDGLGYPMATESGDGVDVYLALREDVWGVLEGEDGEWRRFVAE